MTAAADPFKEAKTYATLFLQAPGIPGFLSDCQVHLQKKCHEYRAKLNELPSWQYTQKGLDESIAAIRKISTASDPLDYDTYHQASRLAHFLGSSHLNGVRGVSVVLQEFKDRPDNTFERIDAAKEAVVLPALRKALVEFWNVNNVAILTGIATGMKQDAEGIEYITNEDWARYSRLLIGPLEALKESPDKSKDFLEPIFDMSGNLRPVLVMERELRDLEQNLLLGDYRREASECSVAIKAFRNLVKPHIDRLKLCSAYAQGQVAARC